MAELQRTTNGSLARRLGYSLGIVVNAVLLTLINGFPGWQAVPFLTAEAARLVPLVNFSLVAGMIANLTYVVVDRRRLKAVGDLITVSISIAVLVATWQLFPFQFDSATVDWALLLRVVLAVSVVGCAIATIVLLVEIVRMLLRLGRSGRASE